MKKLSIISICLNDREGLEKTIMSIADQTFIDFEYIIIDGGSTDGSADLLRKHEAMLSFSVSEKDGGIYQAMNKGLAKATGEYCLFLNAGDFLADKNILKKVFDLKPVEDILYGDMLIDRGNEELAYGKQPDQITFEFMVHSTIWHPVSFIRRELFTKFGYYNEGFRIASDYEFFIKAILVGHSSYRHLPFAVSVFNTKGIGSDPEMKSLLDEERNKILLQYFPSGKIESARQYNILRYSRVRYLADWVKNYPALLKVSSSFYSKIKSLRKRQVS